MSEIGLAEEIASVIADFRQDEIARRSSADVMQFVEQIQRVCQEWMNAREKTLFLEGLRDSLKSQYWSGPKISIELERLLPTLRMGTSKSTWAILSIQDTYSSQSSLVNKVERADIPVISSVIEGVDALLYIDDATFTGKTLAKYLDVIASQIKTIEKRPSKLLVWHLCEYSLEVKEVMKSPVTKLAEQGVSVLFHQVDQFRRRGADGRVAAAMIPSKNLATLPGVQRFLTSFSAFKKFSDSDLLWRDPEIVINDRLFGSVERRDVVERAFLEVGCWLRSQTPNWNALMRPFGFVASFTEPSLGFGSMFCTCFNSSNTSPVALWWGDPDAKFSALSIWKPLLPRRAQ